MARLILATVPLTGHVQPMLLLAKALVARGHELRWYAASKFQPSIEATGARFIRRDRAVDWDDGDVEAAFPALRRKRGLARVKAQLREMFVTPLLDELRDLEALHAEWPADAILGDVAHLGAMALAEASGLPWIQLGISALMVPSEDTAPFGSALPPARSEADRKKNRFLYWLVHRVMFASTNRAYRDARAAAGLAPGRSYFEVLSPDLYLQPTVPSFEYPRCDLPPQVRFIGPLVPRDVAPGALPAWWQDAVEAHARGTPIVLVTQGTLATDPRELIAPTLRALVDAPMLVIATTRATPAELGFACLPANVRVASYVPYQALLPMASAMITNGGYGGVQMALAHGLPLVVAGGSEEKPEIAARVAWCGAGLDLRTGRPRSTRIAAAVRRVLDQPGFRARAGAIAADMRAHDAATEGAALIEEALVARARGVAA
jgi:MGT family glycosyltransferase